MPARRLILCATVALTLLVSACGASGGNDTANKTTTTAKSDKTTTTTKTTTTSDRSDDVRTISRQLAGGDFTASQATCFAKAFVADASDAGIKVATSSSGDPSELSSKDKQVFIDAADGCIDVSDLADKAAEGAVKELGDQVPLNGGEASCISGNISAEYDSSGQFLFEITTNDPTAEDTVSKAIGSCIQPDSLKALIKSQIPPSVPPAVSDCVAQNFVDQNGGTAAAFEVLRKAGSGGDTSALEQQVTTITQACVASTGAGG